MAIGRLDCFNCFLFPFVSLFYVFEVDFAECFRDMLICGMEAKNN